MVRLEALQLQRYGERLPGRVDVALGPRRRF
jgi:hypothetical protein